MQERLKKGYLQWRCRRGTKELDVILNKFLESHYDCLSDSDLREFDLLLDTQDMQLWYWLSGQKDSDQMSLQKIVQLICQSNVNH